LVHLCWHRGRGKPRARQDYERAGAILSPILLVAAEETSPGSVERLEHEYALKHELHSGWAARPRSLTLYIYDRMTLVLEDPGGMPLDRLLGPCLCNGVEEYDHAGSSEC